MQVRIELSGAEHGYLARLDVWDRAACQRGLQVCSGEDHPLHRVVIGGSG